MNIILNDTRRGMLAAIAQEPREVRYFTDGRVQNPLTERTCGIYLDAMVVDGLLTCLEFGDTYAITKKGLEALEASRLTPPAQYTNATTQGRYTQRWAAPARGEAAVQAAGIRSVGIGC